MCTILSFQTIGLTLLSPYPKHRLILIFGWSAFWIPISSRAERWLTFGIDMAPMPALRKYGDTYRQLYPRSAQVIIQPDALRFWKFQSARASVSWYSHSADTVKLTMPASIGTYSPSSCPDAQRDQCVLCDASKSTSDFDTRHV